MGSCEPGQGRKPAAISSHLMCGGPLIRRRPSGRFPGCLALSGSQPMATCPASLMTSPSGQARLLMSSSPGAIGRRRSRSWSARSTSPGPVERDRHGPRGTRLSLHRRARRGQDLGGADLRQGAQLRQPGPAAVPCNQCDICQSISRGDDVDVLEIDGASNRGIDEIRQLRQNVNVRPSRERFKIYIIDEVHMLTREAFNALLKTLEEPPEHVKFIFCTTEADARSRSRSCRGASGSTSRAFRPSRSPSGCGRSWRPKASRPSPRRWNFWPGARPARCATASRCWSNCWPSPRSGSRVADVHAMLGTAGDERLRRVVGRLVRRDAAAALADLGRGLRRRDRRRPVPRAVVGRTCATAWWRRSAAGATCCSTARPARCRAIQAAGRQLGLDGILAAMQILDQTLARLRVSTQGRMLAELALVRICQLEELAELPALIAAIRTGGMLGIASESVGGRGAASARRRPGGLGFARSRRAGVGLKKKR